MEDPDWVKELIYLPDKIPSWIVWSVIGGYLLLLSVLAVANHWQQLRAAAHNQNLWPILSLMAVIERAALSIRLLLKGFDWLISTKAVTACVVALVWWGFLSFGGVGFSNKLIIIAIIFLAGWIAATVLAAIKRALVAVGYATRAEQAFLFVFNVGVFLFFVISLWTGSLLALVQALVGTLAANLFLLGPIYIFWREPSLPEDRYGDAKFADAATLKAKGIIDER